MLSLERQKKIDWDRIVDLTKQILTPKQNEFFWVKNTCYKIISCTSNFFFNNLLEQIFRPKSTAKLLVFREAALFEYMRFIYYNIGYLVVCQHVFSLDELIELIPPINMIRWYNNLATINIKCTGI